MPSTGEILLARPSAAPAVAAAFSRSSARRSSSSSCATRCDACRTSSRFSASARTFADSAAMERASS
eukprot:scaffold238798_cov26-Tisochrysis_lutea.AAC.1